MPGSFSQHWLPRLRYGALLALWLGIAFAAASAALSISSTISTHLRAAGGRAANIIEANIAPLLVRGDTLEVGMRLKPVVTSTGLDIKYVAVADRTGRVVGSASQWLPRPDASSRLQSAAARRLGWLSGAVYSTELHFENLPVGQADFVIAYSAAWAPQNGGGGRFILLAIIVLLVCGVLLAYVTPLLNRNRTVPAAFGLESQDSLLKRASVQAERPDEAAVSLLPMDAASVEATMLKIALDRIDQGLVLTDRRARIRYMNLAAEHLLGWKIRDALDKPIYTALHTLDGNLDPVSSPTERCAQGKPPKDQAQVWLRPRSGNAYPALVRAAAILADNGEVIATITAIEDQREQHKEQLALEVRASVWEDAVDGLDEGLLWLSSSGLVENANAPAARMLGFAREELVGQSLQALFPVPFQDQAGAGLEQFMADVPPSSRRPAVVARRQDGGTLTADFRVRESVHGGERRYLILFRNLDEARHRETMRERIGRVLDVTADEVYVLNAATLRIEEASERACMTLGYAPGELRGMSYSRISPELDLKQFEHHLSELSSGRRARVSLRTLHMRKDGKTYPVDLRLAYAPGESTPVVVALAQDVSEQEQSEARLHFLAHHDPLTGLPNRSLLMDRVQQAIHGADRSRRMFALIFVDLDKFKQVNDTLGHEAGDILLKGVADRLKRSVRSADTVARLSGDEFTLVIGGLTDRDDAAAMVEQLLVRLAEPIEVSGKQLTIGASLGITLYPLDRGKPEELLQHADLAMYEAKQEGEHRYRFYEQEMNEQIRQRAAQQTVLRSALAGGQVGLLFDPVFRAETGQISYVEVQGYWERAGHADVAGPALLEMANRLRLHAVYDAWLLESALHHLKSWREAGVAAVPMILAPALQRTRYAEWEQEFASLLEKTGVDAGMILLDLSGSGLIEDFASGRVTFDRLRELGVRLCASEAAPGVTEIARLARIPLTLLRLGPTCVKSLPDSADDMRYVQAVMGVAHALSLPVMARGIDTPAQLDTLRHAGCTYLEGRLLSAPLKAVELIARLTTT